MRPLLYLKKKFLYLILYIWLFHMYYKRTINSLIIVYLCVVRTKKKKKKINFKRTLLQTYLDIEKLVQQETPFFIFIFSHPGLDIPKILNTEVCGFASVSSHAKMCLKSEYKCFSGAKVCPIFFFFKRCIEEQWILCLECFKTQSWRLLNQTEKKIVRREPNLCNPILAFSWRFEMLEGYSVFHRRLSAAAHTHTYYKLLHIAVVTRRSRERFHPALKENPTYSLQFWILDSKVSSWSPRPEHVRLHTRVIFILRPYKFAERTQMKLFWKVISPY